jgi:kumamolisin
VLYNMGNDYSQLLPLQSQMVNQHQGGIISESWSECDKADSSADATSYKNIYDHAALLGESVFASTGDSGAFECLKAVTWGTSPSPQYVGAALPASAPGVTGVGGTHLSVRQDGSWYDETVWEMPGRTMGSGGAASAFFSRPGWQNAPGVTGNMRSIPDVSADADGNSGASIYTTNPGGSAWWEGGGTSQSAPIWAGMTALINQYLKSKGLKGAGFLNPALYHFAATTQPYPAFHDVTVGTNLYYPAGPGYDLATGLGTPDAWNLARDLEAYQKGGGQ